MAALWDYPSRLFALEDAVVPGDTLPVMFFNAVAQRGEKIALRQKELGIWRSVTWREFGEAVGEVGLGLVALDVQPGDVVSVLANTRKEWLYADLGALGAGCVSSGIYPTDSAAQVEYLCADSDTRVLFVENEEQLDKALRVRECLPRLRRIVVFDAKGLEGFSDPQVVSLERLRDDGRALAARDPGLWPQRLRSRRPDDVAILIYTSGTTGKPKGAMLSHRNILHTLRGLNRAGALDERDERIAFLPLCHVAERVVGSYLALYDGARINFVEHPQTVPENVREIQPTHFGAVPRVWEKFYSAVRIAVAEGTRLERWAYARAIDCGGKVADLVVAGRPVPAGLKLAWRFWDVVCLANIRRMIGIDRARALITGAAPISPDLVRWYLSLGVPMFEVWGQTECCGVATLMPIERIRPGSIGTVAPYNEVRISDEGELAVRGDNVFLGYLNLPEKTAETLRDGWLRTGDVGTVDADGFFRITDRMKDIIITAGGKNVTPSEIENQLKFSPYITDAVVIGDKRPYLVALIMIDQENVERFAQDRDVPFTNYASLCRAAEVRELIRGEIDRVNRQFARVEQVKEFRLIEQQLGAEDEELTPTMKLKRKFVSQKYAGLIDSMYAEPAKTTTG
jgi:long-chain acyl-CoA synthetase